jgi:hypothetical protein
LAEPLNTLTRSSLILIFAWFCLKSRFLNWPQAHESSNRTSKLQSSPNFQNLDKTVILLPQKPSAHKAGSDISKYWSILSVFLSPDQFFSQLQVGACFFWGTSSSGQAPSQTVLEQMVKNFERLVKELMKSLSNPVEFVEQSCWNQGTIRWDFIFFVRLS